MSFTIFHNPRCSKSRKTLNLLKESGIDPEIRLYLHQPPTPEELAEVIKKLKIDSEDLIRKGESVYKDITKNKKNFNPDQLLKIMSENPILIERPIVIHRDKAIIGRPPENVLELI